MQIIDFDDNEKIKDIDDDYAYDELKQVSAHNKSMSQSGDEPEADEPQVTFVGVMQELLSLIVYLAFTFIVVFCIINFVGQRTVVNGSSMEDTLSDGDNLIVDKITYRFKDPERFDVIIFPPRYENESLYIKRVIGLPGESIYIDTDGSIYINQKRLTESYGTDIIDNPGRAGQTLLLGEDEYFVMGDNRINSLDSRYEVVGNIKRKEITGRAWLRFYPFNKFGFVKNIE